MKIAAFYGPDGMKMETHPLPVVPDGMVLLKVEASGICGGEYNIYQKRSTVPIPDEGIILGHEVVGRVVKSAGMLKEGMLVAVSPNSGCGRCWYCQHGLSYECQNKPVHTAQTGGGYAEYMVAEPAQCYALPADISVVKLAMAEPLACCIHSLNRVAINMGERVAVLGAGGGAQLLIQLANLNGAAMVAVFDNMDERLALALTMGADEVCHTDREDAEVKARQLNGFDVVIVTRSAPAFFEQAIRMCAWRGRVLCYGVAAAETMFQVSPNLLWKKQLALIGSRSFEGDAFETAVNLLVSGKVKTEALTNRLISLDQVEDALASSKGQIKTVIVSADI